MYTEYRRTTSLKRVPEVKVIQTMLNNAKKKARMLAEEDKSDPKLENPYLFQQIHHRNTVPSDLEWPILNPDGIFGQNTERAVKAFQNFVFIQPNGIMGSYTMVMLLLIQTAKPGLKSLLNPYEDVFTPDTGGVRDKIKAGDLMPDGSPIPKRPSPSPLSKKIDEIGKIITQWDEGLVTPANSAVFIVIQGAIVVAEHTNNANLYAHFNVKELSRQVNNAILHPEKLKGFQLIHINHNKRFRPSAWRAFNVWDTVQSFGRNIGLAAVGFETVDVTGSVFRGEARIADVARLGFDWLQTLTDFAVAKVNTVGVPIKQTVTRIGSCVVKWKWASRLAGVGGGAVSAGIVVVAIQCVGAFLAGVEIGNYIEKRTHIGETAVNYYWDLFLGDLIGRAIEWHANRIVVVKYPADWTDQQIKEFQEKCKKY